MKFSCLLLGLCCLTLGVLGLEGGSGVVVDIKSDELLKNATNPECELSTVYVYDREGQEKDLHEKFVSLARKLEGFGRFYAVKCSKVSKNFSYCSDDTREERPLILFNRPPEVKINPYTHKPMETIRMKHTSKSTILTNL